MNDSSTIQWFEYKLRVCKKGGNAYIRMRRNLRVYKLMNLYVK